MRLCVFLTNLFFFFFFSSPPSLANHFYFILKHWRMFLFLNFRKFLFEYIQNTQMADSFFLQTFTCKPFCCGLSCYCCCCCCRRSCWHICYTCDMIAAIILLNYRFPNTRSVIRIAGWSRRSPASRTNIHRKPDVAFCSPKTPNGFTVPCWRPSMSHTCVGDQPLARQQLNHNWITTESQLSHGQCGGHWSSLTQFNEMKHILRKPPY